MTSSPERIAANRANALKSTGPKTDAGKAISRRNALKHGLTGEGVALPDEDRAEVERRFANFEAEMAPTTEMGKALAHRAAILTIRLERCYRNEAARLTVAVDSAAKRFDDGRVADLDALMSGLADDPGLNAYRLQQSPEGLKLTIEAWEHLKLDLTHPERQLWNGVHHAEAENLMGRRTTDLPRSRIGVLSRALWHDFSGLDPHEASDLNKQGKYEYARDRMVEIIDERIAAIRVLIGRFDESARIRERAALADRALFDDSKGSILARRYEAATERSLFRTLREFREVEAEAAKARDSKATPFTAKVCVPMASSLPEESGAAAVPAEAAPPTPLPVETAAGSTPPAPPRRRPDPQKLRRQALAARRSAVRA